MTRPRSYHRFALALVAGLISGCERRTRPPADTMVVLIDTIVETDDGRWRYRYCQAAVVTAYSEMSTQPPPFTAVSAPTLLVLGRDSYIPYDHLLDAHRAALGDRLEAVTVDGVHTLLWDAFDQTADAVERFLSRAPA